MRLINADELPVKTDWHKQYVLYTAIEDAPTIDAVPVVRCKDCKNYGDEYFCPLLSLADYTDPNDFCSYGERKDGE